MKVEKNKIVFAAVLAVILIFLIAYSVMVMGDDESENENLEQTLVPELGARIRRNMIPNWMPSTI